MESKDLIDRLQADWQRERPDLDTSAMGIVGRVLLLADMLKKRANDVLATYGLGYTDLDVLATLRRSGEPFTLRPADLLRSVLIQSGSLTACLDRLAKAGFIERVQTPGDRRSRSVRLTEDGLKCINEAIAVRFAEATEAVAPLRDAERDALTDGLRTLVLTLEAASKSSAT